MCNFYLISRWDALEWPLLLWRVGCYEASLGPKNVAIMRRVSFSRCLTVCFITFIYFSVQTSPVTGFLAYFFK